MIFYILAAACGILAIIVYFRGRTAEPGISQKPGKEVTLEELANRLWLKRELELEESLADARASLITVEPIPDNTASPPDKPEKSDPTENQEAPTSPAPAISASPDPQVDQKPAWNHQELVEFEEHFIKPYKNIIAQSQHIIPLRKVMEILDQYGDQSSIISQGDDEEFKIFANQYSVFSGVTLLQHSINVMNELIKIVEATNTRDMKYSIGKYALMCLGHDLGKILHLRSKGYTTGNHPIISAGIMTGLLPPGVAAKEDIITAIRNHHVRYPKNKSTVLLRQADLRAREYEAQAVSVEKAIFVRDLLSEDAQEPQTSKKKLQTHPTVDLSWVDWTEVIARIEKHINVPNSKKWVHAITANDGFAYVQPVLANQILWKLAEEKNNLEFTIYSMKDKERANAVSFSVGKYFRDQGLLSHAVEEPFVNRKFNLVDEENNIVKSGYYMPIDAKIFNTPYEQLKERKRNIEWLMKIKAAIPC